MKSTIVYIALLTTLLMGLTQVAKGQISSPNANDWKSELTDSQGNPIQTIVLAFSSPNPSSSKPHLTVKHPDPNVTCDYQWYYFDELSQPTPTYVAIAAVDGGQTASVTNRKAGGYKVELTNASNGNNLTFFAWVIVDSMILSEIKHNNLCEGLRLELDMLHYKSNYSIWDLSTDNSPSKDGSGAMEQYTIPVNLKCTWASSVDIHEGVPNASSAWKNTAVLFTIINTPPPLFSASYSVNIGNSLGTQAVMLYMNESGVEDVMKDSNGNFLYTHETPTIQAIAVYPIAKVDEWKNNSWTPIPTNQLKGSALFKLRFNHSESINADTYAWVGYDNEVYQQSRGRILWTDTTTDKHAEVFPSSVYQGEKVAGYLPGKYPLKLVVKNEFGCADSTDNPNRLDEHMKIAVENSKFDASSVPNVFTPNGDGNNDYFIFVKGQEPVSIRNIDIRIFTRTGQEIYRYSGRASDWQGWNGKMRGSGATCSSGVYYYSISADGWDGISYGGKPYRSYLHLFND